MNNLNVFINNKNLEKMKRIVIIFLAFTAVALISCNKETKPKLDDGLYIGSFNTSTVAYQVINSQVKPLGYSFTPRDIVIMDGTSFVQKLPDLYYPKSVLCFKSKFSVADYDKAVLNSYKEFSGLHYAIVSNDMLYNGGLQFAIKPLSDTKMLVKIVTRSNTVVYETEADITMDNTIAPHRKLSFKVGPEITSGQTEIWDMTICSSNNFNFNNLFDLYMNGQLRYQVQVIDNGITN